MGNRFAFIANDYEQKYGQPFNNLLSSGGSYGNYGNYGSNYNSGNSSGSIFKNPALAGAMITAGASIFTAALPSIINAFANNNSSKDADNSGNATGTATTATHVDTSKLDALTSRATKTDKKGNTSYKNNVLGTRDNKLSEEIGKVEAKHKELQNDYNKLAGEISKAKSEIEGKKQEQQGKQKEVDGYTQQIDTANKTIDTEGKKSINAGIEITRLKEVVGVRLDRELAALVAELDSAKAQADNSSQETSTETNQEEIKQAKKREEDLEAKINAKEKEINENNTAIGKQKEIKEKADKEVADAKATVEVFTSKKEAAVIENGKLSEEVATLEAKIKEESNLATMKAELDRIYNSLTQAKTARDTLSPAETSQKSDGGKASSSSSGATFGKTVLK